jgi:ADP-ribose pyrophosphatase YjhB (NUDIX family)
VSKGLSICCDNVTKRQPPEKLIIFKALNIFYMDTKWLNWASRLQSIAQAGLTFGENQYDIDRYQQIRDISIEILHEYTDMDHKKIRNLFASESGYQTPKVDIRSAVFKDNTILMVHEKIDGRWSLPGGWADVNTSVSEAAVKECNEEAGAIVRPHRILAIQMANRQNNFIYPYTIYKIFVECELIEYSFQQNTETLGSGFYSLDDLPELSVERNNFDQIKMCFEAHGNLDFKTIFD